MKDDEFEWHDPKAARNLRGHRHLRKRRPGFEVVRLVFRDTDLIEWEDDREDYDETRYIVLGRVGEQVFNVVYTPRDARKRIISVRKATKEEQEFYYENLI